MAYTQEQALNHVIGKGFSHASASAIVDLLGAQEVFEGGDAASSNSGEAVAHVKGFGYSAEAAQKIVEKCEPHIILAHKKLGGDDCQETHSLWDADLSGNARSKSKTGGGSGPSRNQ